MIGPKYCRTPLVRSPKQDPPTFLELPYRWCVSFARSPLMWLLVSASASLEELRVMDTSPNTDPNIL